MHEKYPKLFEPLKVNHVVLKNRIISAPLGSLTDKSLSGIAMIIRGTSGSVDDPRMRLSPGPYCFADLFTAAKVREQVSVIRQAGAKAEFELCHCGQFAMVDKNDYAIGPVSFIRDDGTRVQAMDEEMMKDIAAKYAKSALDAKEYGFDSILLHFAHGWLPAQFLSPYFNHRDDEYGGSLENRMKFPTMIVDAVRKAVGPDYMLDIRISGDEHLPGGMPIEEVVTFLKSIEDRIDMVHISCGVEVNVETKTYMSSTQYLPHLINIELSKKVKEALHIPVAVVGGIMTPEEAESVLEGGYADAVVIGRQLIADPWWVKKAWECRSEDITPCIRCMNCYNPYQYHTPEDLKAHTGMNTVPNCSVNPRYLHEDRVPNALSKAEVRKKVVIIGGGPAGMKAAITADQRGHEVHLYEKENVLGGQLVCAEYDETKRDLKRYKDYLITQIEKSNVHVHLGVNAIPEMFEKDRPDVLILALGAEPAVMNIEGKEDEKVIDCISAFKNIDSIGKNVVILGGGSIGCELGVELSKRGHHVSIIARRTLLRSLNDIMRASLNLVMKECENLKTYTYTSAQRITKTGVEVKDKEGNTFELPADTIVMAVGMKSKTDEANSFYGYVQDTNIIGDANRVGTIWNTAEDGYYIAAHL